MAISGAAFTLALQAGMWGAATLASLAGLAMLSYLAWQGAYLPIAARPPAGAIPGQSPPETDTLAHRLLLDATPTPLVALYHDHARALNRAARQMFGTDARILPVPSSLADQTATHLRHEGRRWRIDRVRIEGEAMLFALVALVDVESEANLAEARASAELIEVLGHELLNGLAAIVSLAQSAQDAARIQPIDEDLLQEILGPLVRRANGLERFSQAYRELARLPPPQMGEWDTAELARELQQTFAGKWPSVELTLQTDQAQLWRCDRDQIVQALWALLNNAAEAASEGPDPHVGLTCRVDANRLIFEVSDSGKGVAPESAAHIFRLFHTTRPQGSGVGLSLARQIAQSHGGTVEITGAKPTTFSLTLG
jgi:signal transduction histidine kinase